jgi:hypothetical protein
MYDGWLKFGDTEVISRPRAHGYALSSGVGWLKCDDCDGIRLVEGDDSYEVTNIDQAPWHDSASPESERFYGSFPISVGNIYDSTRSGRIVEGILDGGVVAGIRSAVKEVRIRTLLLARGTDAMEYGAAWLAAALSDIGCTLHTGACGEVSVEFFASCPPIKEDTETDEDFKARVDGLRRFMHGVSNISGPIELERFRRQVRCAGEDFDVEGMIMEFTFAATSPYTYSVPQEINPNGQVGPPGSVQDTPYNLITHPSAELSNGTIILTRNYATNPSVEVDATGWSAKFNANIPAASQSSGQSADLASVGTKSFRARVVGNAGATPASNVATDVSILTTVPVSGLADRTRMSISLWAAAIIAAGSSGTTITKMMVKVSFLDAANKELRAIEIPAGGPADYSGHVYSVKSELVPTGTTQVQITASCDFTFSSSANASDNTDLRFYADALAVTVP